MDDRAAREALLAEARAAYRAGSVTDALDACRTLAGLSRAAGDTALLVQAALLVRRPVDPALRALAHALATEALAAVGDSDPLATARLSAQASATEEPMRPEAPVARETPADPETEFLLLQAEIADLPVPSAAERVVVAGRAVDLGRLVGDYEYECWGRRWRMDGYAVLGRRAELADELSAATPRMQHLGPEWASYALLARASQQQWEGRFDEALASASRARELGGAGSDAAYLHLVFEHAVAARTGVGLDEVEAQVRRVVDGLPHLARAWLCSALVANGRTDEARQVWQAVAPHLGALSDRAREFLVAAVGAAEVCAVLEDRETAELLYGRLVASDGLHAIAHAHTPYEGPVGLALGRLARLLGRPEAALAHLDAARVACEASTALPALAETRAELARVHGPTSRTGRDHAHAARRLAAQLGMRPLTERLGRWASTGDGAPHLTAREREVADLVSQGLSNAAVATRLTLSERTVESHVSRVLHKLGLGSRTALAVWVSETRSLEAAPTTLGHTAAHEPSRSSPGDARRAR